jgi:prophage antirepressor-like protein
MKNLPQIFNYHGIQVRTVSINNEPWFVLKDLCDVLDLSNHRMVKDRLSDDVSSTYPITDSLGRPQDTTVINEDGLYDVILESRKPEAKAFRKWVTSQVLPSIRKTGTYSIMVPKSLPEALRAYATEVEKNEILMLENQELKIKTRYVDSILKSKGTVTITQIAKDYGMSGPQLNKILHEEKVQYKQNKQWLLYHKHQDKGYTKSETIDITRSNGDPDVTMNTRWTQKGRLFIHEILTKREIIPYMDRETVKTDG